MLLSIQVPINLSDLRILVVDDEQRTRNLLKDALKALGFLNVTLARDGSMAWQLFVETSPPFDLVISDWNMPRMSGLDLLKRVRIDLRAGKVPFILVTAERDRDQVTEALKFEVTDYIVKPFTLAVFSEKMFAVCNKIDKSTGDQD